MSFVVIKRPIGGRNYSDPLDLNNARKIFRDFGLYDSDETGPMVDAPLDRAIKAFQGLRGLKIDGIINPGGETENEIAKIKTGKPSSRFVQNQAKQNDARENSIGFGGNPLGVLPPQKPEVPKRSLLGMYVKKEKPKDFEQEVQKYNFSKGGDNDFINALKNPYKSFEVNKIANQVSKETAEIFGQQENLRNNEADAFRHALWSYRLTKKFGSEISKKFTDGHERDSVFKDEILMDLKNNEVGRNLAENKNNTKESDIDVIMRALKGGKLRTKPYEVRD